MRRSLSVFPGAALAAALLVVLAPPKSLTTQKTGRIEGTITDGESGTRLDGAQVIVQGTGLMALSDREGRYVIEQVGTGKHSVLARRIGYNGAAVTNVVVKAGKTVTVDFKLALATATTVETIGVADAAGKDRVVVDGRTAGDTGIKLAPGRVVAEQTAIPLAAPPVAPSVAPSVQGPYPWQYGQSPKDREEYGHLVDNSFRAVSADPVSTFAADVDRASYANVRRILGNGSLPPVDAVRIEEFINYFSYDYAGPLGEDPIAIHAEVGPAPWRPGHRLVRIGIQARKMETEALPPSNLVFLLDVSGSMRPENKLPLVQSAFRLLVDQLRAEDRVAIVVYAGAAGEVLASTPGNRKAEIIAAIDRLQAGGSTAGGAGIKLAYDVAQGHLIEGGNNRVILATDGDFNVGVSGEGELVRLIEEKRKSGVFLTVVAVGEGNLQDRKMEQLADHGNGNYAYIDDMHEARKVFVQELGGTLVTVAKDVKIQIEFNPARVRAYRLIGYENRLLRNEDFNNDTKDAGDMGAGHSVTALYEIVPVGATSDVTVWTSDSLRYQTTSAPARTSAGRELAFVKFRYKTPEGEKSKLLDRAIVDNPRATASTDFAFQTAVAEFGLLLRKSEHRGNADAAALLERARTSLGEDPDGYRAEFVRLAELARSLGLGRIAQR